MDDIVKEIRNSWFKDHKANYMKINDDLKILEWKNPNTLHMNVRYVMDKHNVYITGDLYSAMLCLTQQANLESLGKYNLYYFSQKVVMMEQGKTDFNSEKAIGELKENFKEWWDIELDSEVDEEYYKHKEVLEMLVDGADESNNADCWIDFIKLNYNEIDGVDPDCHEWIFDIGMETSRYLYAYLEGLKMAYEQLIGE